ncbi:MAG: hypothetical protein JJT95_13115 [Pararhodobacter sp.]|nr:hypothetical protein [Pararhodobacter sp.]
MDIGLGFVCKALKIVKPYRFHATQACVPGHVIEVAHALLTQPRFCYSGPDRTAGNGITCRPSASFAAMAMNGQDRETAPNGLDPQY